ncbi:hypothetical protein [Qipengyuania qiaonensis]|uniref:DUF3800 domain-containing protein n=1 Tax=Qipengyuania qiaonensis TaxID=2867240 RepID=A0ABS7J7P6_9SPHN|nr:hypothetical protein [Qipengyuania qiaonensis]MBX7481648.1 hypothetical protein [Qipengyuania qiaonensis]
MLDLLEKRFDVGFPDGARGQQLLMVSDFSGTHAGSAFTSYAFLSLDIDQNPIWLAVQREFRQSVLRRRRMAYKSLNDRARRQALPHFLQLADQLTGALAIVAIPRGFGPLLEDIGSDAKEALQLWKPSVHEHLLRVTHLGGMFAAAMSREGQDVMIITDEDEVASNVSQLTQLTELFSRVLGNSLTHNLGHIRVGTTQSDDGTLALEDLAAIADLAAGALCEILSAMEKRGYGPRKGIISLLPQVASPKARLIGHWLASNQASLQRAIIMLEKPEGVGAYKAGMLELHSITGNVWMP